MTDNVMNEKNLNEMDKTYNLWKENEKKIKVSESKDVVLVIGKTGSGVSTFVQWFATNENQLKSKEIVPGSGKFIIEEETGDKIRDSNFISKTFFPDLIIGSLQNTVFYDCPGFENTNGAAYDMTVIRFVNKISQAKEIKIVFILTYSQIEESEKVFFEFLRHAIEFIKDVDKFKNSLCIVVTKVENRYSKIKSALNLVPDSIVRRSIVEFLNDIKKEIESKSSTNSEEEKFNTESIKFLDELLAKNGEKIGIFRMPDQTEWLDEILILRNEKEYIRDMIYNWMNFSPKNNSDFGFTLSEESKNTIRILTKEISDKATGYVQNIVEETQKYYESLTERIQDKMKSLNDEEYDKFYLKDLNDGFNIISNMIIKIEKSNNFIEISKTIKTDLREIGISLSNQSLSSIANLEEKLDFLRESSSDSDTKISSLELSRKFEILPKIINESKFALSSKINEILKEIKNQIKLNVQNVKVKIYEYYQAESNKSKSEITIELENLKKKFSEIERDKLTDTKKFAYKMKDFLKNIDINEETEKILNYGKKLEFLGFSNENSICISDSLFEFWENYFIKTIEKVKEFFFKNKEFPKTIELVNELKELDFQFINEKNPANDDFLFFYNTLLTRISVCAKNANESEKSDDFKKIRGYLYVTTLSKINTLKLDSDSSLIIDVEKYLDSAVTDINVLKNLQNENGKYDLIANHTNEYKKDINDEIELANKIVKEITPELEEITKKLSEDIDKFVDEIIKYEKNSQRTIEELQKKKQELNDAMILKGILAVSKIALTAFSFLGPVAALVSTLAVPALKILDPDEITHEIPEETKVEIEVWKNRIGLLTKSNAENETTKDLMKLLNELSEKMTEHTKNDNSDTLLNDLQENVEKFKKNLASSHTKKDLKKFTDEFNAYLKIKKSSFESKRKRSNNKKYEKELKESLDKIKKELEKIGKMVEFGVDAYKQFQKDKKTLQKIEENIALEKEKFERLKEFEDNINSKMRPMLNSLGNDLNEIVKNSKSKPQVALDVTKWKVQDVLRDTKLKVQQISKGFKASEDILRCIEKQEETMTLLIGIFDRVQSYQGQKKIADFISAVSSAHKTEISDRNLSKTYEELDIKLRSNLIIKQHERIINAVKQWVFPFAAYFLEDSTNNIAEKNYYLVDLASEAKKKVVKIKEKINNYKATIPKMDAYIRIGHFGRDKFNPPFYVFKNEQHKQMISELFSGNETVAKVDIQNSEYDKDAIKFNSIAINFKTEDEKVQSEINEILKEFNIIATHLGNSYYRFNKKFYTMTSPIQQISFTFLRDEKGDPSTGNVVNTKLKKSDMILSPYAMWKFKFEPKNNSSIQHLKKYAGSVDLELTGYGNYVVTQQMHEQNEISVLQMDKYYKADDSIDYIERKKFKRVTRHTIDEKNTNEVELKTNEAVNHLTNAHKWSKDNLRLENRNESGLKKEVKSSIDTNGNLVFAQLFVGKIFGGNKHLYNNTYLSPQQEITLKINETAKRILPALEFEENDF